MGWRGVVQYAAAAATPVFMLVTGGAFFTLSIMGLAPNAVALATAGVVMGAVTQVRTKRATSSVGSV